MSTNIYILRLEGGNYYVGKSDNPAQRFVQHMNGEGATWTKIHRPMKVLQVIENASPFDEDKNVKELMAKYGIDKVRGGTYVQETLSEAQEESLKREIRAATDCCTRCGKKNHFVANCWVKEINKSPPAKKSITPIRRIKYQEEFDKPKSKPTINKFSRACYRCGRTSHRSTDCYATTDIDGQELTEDEDDEDEDDEDEDDEDEDDEDEDDEDEEDDDDLDTDDIDLD